MLQKPIRNHIFIGRSHDMTESQGNTIVSATVNEKEHYIRAIMTYERRNPKYWEKNMQRKPDCWQQFLRLTIRPIIYCWWFRKSFTSWIPSKCGDWESKTIWILNTTCIIASNTWPAKSCFFNIFASFQLNQSHTKYNNWTSVFFLFYFNSLSTMVSF